MRRQTPKKSKVTGKIPERPPLSYQELESVRAHDIITISSGKSDTDSDVIMVSSNARPSRSSKNTRTNTSARQTARLRRNVASSSKKRDTEEEIPEEFREMLVESYKEKPEMFIKKQPPSQFTAPRNAMSTAAETPPSSKKRKREQPRVDLTGDQSDGSSMSTGDGAGKPHVILDSSADEAIATTGLSTQYQDISDNDEEDEFEDVDWENVDLSKADLSSKLQEPLILNLSKVEATKPRRPPKRAPPTAVERKIRLEVHKLHLLCLLSHVYARSCFCNDAEVQELLSNVLDSKRKAELLNKSSFGGRLSIFRLALKAAAQDFRKRFEVTRPGIRKPLWHDGEVPYPSYGDLPIRLAEFREAAKTLEGSRDLGAQLFCALLRGIGVPTRLVVSLQVLSYTFKTAYVAQLTRKGSLTVTALEKSESEDSDYNTSDEEGDLGMAMADTKYGGPGPVRTTSNFRNAPHVAKPKSDQNSPKKAKVAPKKLHIRDPRLPIYWMEAFDIGRQEWIPVDSMVTGEIGHPVQYEPNISEAMENEMSYVVAFEAEGQAKDVTRRYVKSYNGKTRTLRVESTQEGTRWWARALRRFRRGYPLDRDQIEEAALSEREVAEGIPKNIEAFKTHPHFAIERHLRRNEVITPKRQVSVIYGKDKQAIPVYRRQDVKIVRTARQWYSLGREVKVGEQSVKTWKRKTPRREERGSSIEDGDEVAEEGMYTEAQTSLYVPPAVVFGIIPKNAYGNLDVFVPSMIPEGAVHLPNKMMVKAAKLLSIDYAEAVTGFEFKGRASTAIIKGIVAAKEHKKALEAVAVGFEDELAEAEADKKQIEMLKMWRKFLIGLRIKERLDDYGSVEDQVTERSRKGKEREVPVDGSGGFLRQDTNEDERMILGDENQAANDGGGGFLPEDMVNKRDGVVIAEEHVDDGGGFLIEDVVDDGGGFLIEDVVDDGGGFLIEDVGDDEGGGFLIEGDGSSGFVAERAVDDSGGGFTAEEVVDDGGGEFIPEEEDDGGGSGSPPEDSVMADAVMDEDDDIRDDDFEYEEDPGWYSP